MTTQPPTTSGAEPTPDAPNAPEAPRAPSMAPSRRTLLRAAGGVGLLGAAAAVGGARLLGPGTAEAVAAGDESALSSHARSLGAGCVVLNPEVTEGPFYLPDELVRRDIRENEAGFALDLTFKVMDSTTCKPVPKAAVDIWHCNALGVYSGVAQEAEGLDPTDSDSFLRGIQVTDDTGHCRFVTIVPGWYPGRAVHIHLKVHVGGRVSHRHYVGGEVCHTGQVFFGERMLGKVEKLDPYDGNGAPRVRNDNDSIYHQAGGRSAIVPTRTLVHGDPTGGYRGTMVLGVDPGLAP